MPVARRPNEEGIMKALVFLTAVLCLALTVPATIAIAEETGRGHETPGLVVSVTGEVSVGRGERSLPVTQGFVLRAGDRLVARTGGHCAGFAPDGSNFDLRGPGEVEFGSASEGALGSAVAWLRLQLAEWIGESQRRPLTARGVRDWKLRRPAVSQLLPANNGAVRADRPLFRWTECPTATAYKVVIAPESGEEKTYTVRDCGVRPDDLVPGGLYVWRVAPEGADGIAAASPWREFRVLTEEDENAVDSVVRELSDLEAGVALLAAGLHEEAVYRFDAAVGASGDVGSARLWRARALSDIGLYEDAYDDMIAAWGER